ncbi:MAG TPA: histone deacetylase family protein [Acetobacteraceae bacterium]|nr:histone deacetylase family protein [Acetobacteraceae bacterium]
MPVALFTHPACLGHEPGASHPECPDRLRVVLQALEHPDFVPLLRERAPEATHEQLTAVHPADYVADILEIRPPPGEVVALDGDTLMSAGSADAALRAAGGACAAVDAVMEGWARAAFVATRPPGHHAEPARAMGFCLFANAAIAARHAQARWGLQRVAVLDFDVHHGNGTQAILAGDSRLFYGSTHQHPCYPGTGLAAETGIAGNVVNVPLPPGTTGEAFRAAWELQILPALRDHGPELLIVSAGFDAHRADPMAQLRLDTSDFGWITDRLLAVAEGCCGGRIVSVLEGGYDLGALATSAALHVRRLMRN